MTTTLSARGGLLKKTGQENLKRKPNRMSFLDRLKIRFNIDMSRKHSHDRENARRRRQIERGILKVYEGGMMHKPMGGA